MEHFNTCIFQKDWELSVHIIIIIICFYCAEINSAQIWLRKLLQKLSREEESTTKPGRRFQQKMKTYLTQYLSSIACNVYFLAVYIIQDEEIFRNMNEVINNIIHHNQLGSFSLLL